MRLYADEAREYGKRGRKALTNKFRYRVGDENLTTKEIAARLGVSPEVVRYRLAHRDPPYTLESLS